MRLSGEALFFQAEDGSFLVYGNIWGAPMFWSPDGTTFFELHRSGFGGSTDEHDISFDDPHHNTRGRLHRKEDEVVLDNKTYKKVDGRPEIEVVPLPTIRQPEYLFRLPDGRYVYVSADKYRYSYESFRLFIGDEKKMSEVSIRNVERYRDGGTTIIETTDGVLFSPTPFRKNARATWNKTELAKLNPLCYHISETDTDVHIEGA